jgi:hypothetical protein
MKTAYQSTAMDYDGDPMMSIGTLGREMFSQAIRDKDIRSTLLNLGVMKKEHKGDVIILRLKQCNMRGLWAKER